MTRRAGLLLAILWLAAPALVAGRTTRDGADPGAAVTAALAEAERHLAAGEPQVAESIYRGALRDAWHLLGLVALAEGDPAGARDALERSTLSAAIGVLAPRIDLALVQHRLGETADALQRLRALTRQFRPRPEAWRALIGTLAADGRRGEVAEQLDELRTVLPEVAAELEASLAGLETTEPARAARPAIDLGRLGEDAERQDLGRAAFSAVDQARLGLAEARARAHAATSEIGALLDAAAAEEALAPAVDAIRTARLREAEGLLRRAQKQGHDSPAVSRLLALVREASGPGVRARLGLARLAGRDGAFKAALGLLAEARRRAPSSEEVLAAEARIATSAGLTALALEALEPLAGIFPDVAEYAYLLGAARVRQGAMTDAVMVLERSVELAPEESSYRLALARALNQEKRFDEAERHLARILEKAPGDLAAVAALAQAEEGQGKLESAERRARDVLARQPSHAEAHLVIGMVRMKQERHAEARAALEQALAADPGATKAHYQLSLACMRLGDPESARRHQELYDAAQASSEGEAVLLQRESSAPSNRR